MIKKVFSNLDRWLLISSAILFIIGIVMIFSSSTVSAYQYYVASPYRFFIKQIIFLGVSIVLALIIIRFSSRAYCAWSWVLLLIFISALAFLLVYGQVKNQAISWIDFGFFTLQPSEFIKVIFIIWMASYYTIGKKIKDNFTFSLFPIIMAGLIFALILLQPDLGTGLIFSLIVFLVFISLPIKKIDKMKCIGAALIFALLVAGFLVFGGKKILLNRQSARLHYDNPCSEEKFYSTGNQLCNGFIAINNGGLFGKGLGNSTQKYLYLPEAHTDFIFCIIIEELGFVVAIVILILYFIVLWRIFLIAKRSYTDRGAIMCYGIFLMILLHIVVNLGGVFGIIPLTGVPLPFMSYGGSFTMCLVVSLAIVQRVNYETRTRIIRNIEKNVK